MARINDNFTLRAPVPVDDKQGWWDEPAGEWKPFNDVQHALDTVVYYRYRTLTLPVIDGGEVVEYWFKDGVQDSDFVRKNTASDLSNYYTKTELQTSGQSQVHWDNLTNVPSIQSPLTFENGLREDGGVVKLGLDLTTVGTTNKGLLTEPTLLVYGDILTGDYSAIGMQNDIIVAGDKLVELSTSNGLLNTAKVQTAITFQNPDLIPTLRLNRSVNGDNQDIYFDATTGIVVTDDINQKGLEETADYSANKTAYSYVTKMMLDAVAADIPDLTGYATEQWVLDRNYITLADVPSQIQTDWDATTGLASILNKPNLATVAITGDYNDLINQPSIPDLTGYATETWVTSQGYLTSVPWSFNVNNGDLTINGVTNNLDGRWLERSEGVITQGYGITVNGDLATGMGIELDTTVVDNRYLRKDVNDSNGANTLTLGGLVSGNAEFTGTVTLGSVATGTGDEILLYGPGGVIQRKTLSFEGSFGVANSGGTKQFDVDLGTNLRFAGTGDTVVSFNSSTNTVTINSVPGQGGGGVITSVFGRTGPAIVAETGDYNTTLVNEGTNLYFTEPRVLGTDLAGFTVGSNASIAAADTILQAFGKVQGQINARVPTSRTISISGTSGNITVSGTTTQNLGSNASWTINLPNKGTAGTYTKVTTDAQGRVASGGSLVIGDLPSSVVQTLSTSPVNTGVVSISDGNTINLTSLYRTIVDSDITSGWPSTVNSGLNSFVNSGSTGWPSSNGSGIYLNRAGVGDFRAAWMLWKSSTLGDQTLRVNFGTSENTWGGWKIIADRDWVTSQIPTDYVTTGTAQTGLSGAKSWNSAHTFNGNTLTIHKNGGTTNQSFTDPHLKLTASSNPSQGDGIVGITMATSSTDNYGISLAALRGESSGATPTFVVRSHNNSPEGTEILKIHNTGQVTVPGLSGSGTQMVTVNASGVLSRQAIPAVGVTSVAASVAGAALNVAGTPITSTGTLAFTWGGTTAQYVTGAGGLATFPTIPTVNNGTLTLATGAGLSGSASFSANQSGIASFTVAAASGYSIPTNTQIGNWNTAYGWGDYRQFGLGASMAVTDADALTGNQFFSTSSAHAFGFGSGVQFQRQEAQLRAGQIHIANGSSVTEPIVKVRAGSTSGWGPIRTLWHDGNFNPSNYQTTITGAATTIVSSNLIAGRAVATTGSGKIGVSATTATELAYLSGATSNIQTQLNGKFNNPSGTTAQYIRGDGSIATFPSIPSGTVTSISAGNGMNFTTITGSGSVTLGTPGTITGSSANAVTSTSHTHALTLVSGDITGALGFTPVTNARTLQFGTTSGITISNSSARALTSNLSWTIGLAQATSGVLGGIELFSDTVQSVAANAVSATAGRTYGIQLNSAGQAVVNVPWTSGTSVNLVTVGSTSVGAIEYAGVSSVLQNGKFWGGTFNPSDSPSSAYRLNYGGEFRASRMYSMDTLWAKNLELGLSVVSSGTTINMEYGFHRLPNITASTTYTLSNNTTQGRGTQCRVVNTGASVVSVSVTGARLLGLNTIPNGKVAVISVINFGTETVYTVIAEA